ncbi:quinolinate synthase NadA [Salidesulfovibrio onnuriiensis]|uniref:quinolinate synthase NadA n=1 Tax=Salidesulfovibrio onnuriiensis TaxID=2583823 RepID=UPI0011CAEE93|nr:quinolinate synthase NadA [Salidesulfovibrio onnuriiensis]
MSTPSQVIERIRKEMGSRLAIVGHHYQADEIIQHADITGDSLELSRKVAELEAEYIVFCGVYFMAESAAILRRENQKVFLPDTTATCAMAEMATADNVDKTLEMLSAGGRRIIPLTYVNSTAAVKTVVGRWGGTVCTSANAQTMMRWAMDQGDAILFLPDRHLGWNTGDVLGIPESERFILDRGLIDGDPKLFVDAQAASKAKLILWPGFCPIHEEFVLREVERIRKEEPEAKIIVHPECPPEVTSAADANGSTSFIIKYVEEAAPGTKIYVATETNLVHRLAKRYRNVKVIEPLQISYCEDMGKITEANLAALLEHIEEAEPVDVTEEVREHSKVALETMLNVCA